jgi:hypothetical protein
MKIFQTIHKYLPHIPQFEKKYGINNKTQITFSELRDLIINDGYADSYILLPALEKKHDEVFYTIWDYERLQYLWAAENNLDTKNLDDIKLAQIKKFKPDVFYNHSPIYDGNFIEILKISGFKGKCVCWNGVVELRPKTFALYDAHVTLHKPYIKYWNNLGLKCKEIQPAIPDGWNFENNRVIDVLFYGQYVNFLFTKRNQIIDKLAFSKKLRSCNVNIHLECDKKYKSIIKLPVFGEIKSLIFPRKKLLKNTQGPIYGAFLRDKLEKSKIVVNSYGDFNHDFKSNMRLYESMGHGCFLISERGIYPEGLIPDVDFYTYENFEELELKILLVLNNWPKHKEIAANTAKKVRNIFSKERQYRDFLDLISSLN